VRGGLLRDEFRWQMEIKVGGSHIRSVAEWGGG
jgi:hypothetical protein